MQNDNVKLKIIYSGAAGAIGAVIFITLITIAADLYLPLENWLADVFFHHWIGKGALSIAVFIIAGSIGWFLPLVVDEGKTVKILKLLVWLLILGSVLIFLFFVYETVWK